MTSTAPFCLLLTPKLLDQDEIIEILDQAKVSEWNEAMFNANIDIFEMCYEESVS
jgi:hypothetical protein